MRIEQKLFFICIVLIYGVVVFRKLYAQRLNFQYALLWITIGVVMLVISIFPEILIWLARITGIEVSSNLVFLLASLLVMMIVLNVTFIISRMNNRIVSDTQAIALMDKRIRDLEARIKTMARQEDERAPDETEVEVSAPG